MSDAALIWASVALLALAVAALVLLPPPPKNPGGRP
jgi:hypothetical protein